MIEPLSLPIPLREKGYSFVWVPETESTNADALQAVRSSDKAPCWYVAGTQSSGRGRSGRHWISPIGNLYASLLLKNPCDMAVAPQLGFIAGIALYDAVSKLTELSAPRLQLKWPNDLLLDGKKLAGLLLEAQASGSDIHVVIGCGVNLAHKPEGLPYPVAALHDISQDITLDDLFTELSLGFDTIFSFWQKSAGQSAHSRFQSIRTLWLERAAGLGSLASVTLPKEKITGIFSGIDGTGRLELQTDNGLKILDAGDLFFSPSAE